MPETYNARRLPLYSPDELYREFSAVQRQVRLSATDKLLGRSSTGGGVIEEITCTAAGRALIDDASASAQRTTLGLGTAAVEAYTEGTFAPALTFGGAAVGMTFTTTAGSYEKIGKNTHIRLRLTLSAKGSSTGAAVITGLPFTIWNNTNANAVGPVWYGSLAGLAGEVLALTVVNTTTLALYDGAAASMAVLDDTNFTNTSDLILSLTYRAA